MDVKEVEELLELYGLERILEDNRTSITEIVDILIDLGYLDLDMYLEEDI